MKKIVCGGFSLLAGILLFWMANTVDSLMYGTNIPEIILSIIAAGFFISGFVLGVKGLREE